MKKLIFSIFFPFSLLAQLPETDIWLFKLEKKEGKLTFSGYWNITNRPGYDNQPAFSADEKSILYVSIDSTKQADVYRYDIQKKIKTNLTNSKVSEYSPTLLPNRKGFSCVVVEQDSAQRIWAYNSEGKFDKIMFPNIDSIGYHTWLNEDSLLYYKLTDPHSLRAASFTTEKDVWLSDEPSRSFKTISHSSNFIYAQKTSEGFRYMFYDVLLKESHLLAKHPSFDEDFIWHFNFGLIKSEGADLMVYNDQTKTWLPLLSLSNAGIKKITRFIFDSRNKYLVVVNNL